MTGIRGFFQRTLPSTSAAAPSPAAATDVRVYDVTENALDVDFSSMDWIRTAPVWMTVAERLLLFSLIYGLRPQKYLEIGTFQGGSAILACRAMDMTGSKGSITCIDPEPKISTENWALISQRANLLEGLSPQILPQAVEAAGGAFDFVLIDGDHSYQGVKRDAEGVLPFVADGAYLLYGVGAVTTPESDTAIAAMLDAVHERMRPWTASRTLLGFAEQQQGLAASFPPEVAERLARVKADRDPEGLILGNHVDRS